MHINYLAATSLAQFKNMPPAIRGHQVYSAFEGNDAIRCHLDWNTQNALICVLAALENVLTLQVKSALNLVLNAHDAEHMQIIASLVCNDYNTELGDELQEQVPWVLGDSEHLHHGQVLKVHLILQVKPQYLF